MAEIVVRVRGLAMGLAIPQSPVVTAPFAQGSLWWLGLWFGAQDLRKRLENGRSVIAPTGMCGCRRLWFEHGFVGEDIDKRE